jgi:tRNA(Ile)-lysidine synthase TilS/MesJ
MQNILGYIRRADNDFGLIENGDKIAVGLSGGKDSLTLVHALANYKQFGIKQFDLVAVSVDCTDGQTDFSKITEFCKTHGVKHYVEPSQIFKIIFDIRHEKSPCSLCSKLRRGILNSSAVKHGCNKVALGHHADDVIETFLLSLLYEGRLSTMKAKTYLSRADITTIRPMVYVPEAETIANANRNNYPILNNCCSVNGKTQRQAMKDLVTDLDKKIAGSKIRMRNAIDNLL